MSNKDKDKNKNGYYKIDVEINNHTSNGNNTFKLQNYKQKNTYSSYNSTFIKAFKNYLINKNKTRNENEYNPKR
ncbi:MAG: hypothetical protein N3A67_07475 [Ignavibacteria bacterium]|nr:hypothetical protein [Ignavibacteria bacterium]